MLFYAAVAGNVVGEYSQTFEAKACAAIPAHHLVALSVLGVLTLQMLLGDGHFTLRALHRTSLNHPLPQARFFLRAGLAGLLCLLHSIFLAR
jgi:hypothetical protein